MFIQDKTEHFKHKILRYQSSGVPKYEIMDCNDERVCSCCNSHRNKIYHTEQAVIGLNCPPFHDDCRCDIYPIFD